MLICKNDVLLVPNVFWTKPEEIFDFMINNELDELRFNDERDTLKNISLDLGKYFFVTRERLRTVKHKGHTYNIRLYHPSPIFLGGMLINDISSEIAITISK